MADVKLTGTELTDEDVLRIAVDTKRALETDFERVRLREGDDSPRLAEYKERHEALKAEIKRLEKPAAKGS